MKNKDNLIYSSFPSLTYSFKDIWKDSLLIYHALLINNVEPFIYMNVLQNLHRTISFTRIIEMSMAKGLIIIFFN